MDHSAFALAQRLLQYQEGVVSLDQLKLCGLTRRDAYALHEAKRLTLLGSKVFGAWGAPTSFQRDILAGILILGDGAVVSHRAAARLWGFEHYEDVKAEFTTPRARRNRALSGLGLVVHSTTQLGAGDTDRIGRPGSAEVERDNKQPRPPGLLRTIPVTSASRTIIDLCTVADVDDISAAVDSACRLGLISPDYLARFAQRHRRGRVSVAKLDDVLLDAGVHSWLEREFLKLLRKRGLPTPRTQVVHRTSTTQARVDFEFTDHRLIVEVSGRRGHSSDNDRRRDAERRNQLQQEGFVVLEFLTHDILQTGDAVAATVATALKARPPAVRP